MKRKIIFALGVFAVLHGFGTVYAKGKEKSPPLKVTIIHVNDHHSHLEADQIVSMQLGGKSTKVQLGGYPEVLSLIKDIRKDAVNPITLHAGDAITGTLYFTLFGGSADAAMMRISGFDFFTLGNHEFDAGNEGLKKFLNFLNDDSLAGKSVPVISGNVNPDKKSILYGMWTPYEIIERDGQKIGIIGSDTVTKTVCSSSPGKDVKFTDEVKTAQKWANELKKKGVNKIILLSHGGAYKNFEIAQKTSGIDVIITGDSHILFGNEDMKNRGLPVKFDYPSKFKSKSGEPVYVVEGWEYSKFVGELLIDFDEDGIVSKIEGKPHVVTHTDWFERRDENNKKYVPAGKEKDEIVSELSSLPYISFAKADAQAKEILAKYKADKERLGNQVVGTIKGSAMPGGTENRIPHAGNPKGSVATRFVAETMLSEMRHLGDGNIDFAIQNSGGVRADITAGDVTFNQAYTYLPFGNTLFTVEVTGAEAKQILEDALDYALKAGASTGAFPYSAGLRYEANKEKDANGKRLVKVEVEERKTKKWVPIKDDTKYVLAVNSFISNGKDGYKTLGDVIKKRGGTDTYLPDAESFIKFLKTHPDFTSYTDSNAVFHFE